MQSSISFLLLPVLLYVACTTGEEYPVDSTVDGGPEKTETTKNPSPTIVSSAVTDLVPTLIVAESEPLVVVDLGDDFNQVDDSRFNDKKNDGGDDDQKAIVTDALDVINTYDLPLEGGGSITLALSEFSDPALVTVSQISDEMIEDNLASGGFDLEIPGVIVLSDITKSPDLVSRSDGTTGTDLIAALLIDTAGQATTLGGKDLFFTLPPSALPVQWSASTTIPASTLPVSSMPEDKIPENAIASQELPASVLPISDLLAEAKPARALPLTYFLAQSEEDLVVEALVFFIGDDGSKGASRCDSEDDLTSSATEGLHFRCKVEDDLPAGKATVLVFGTTKTNYYEARLNGLPIALMKPNLKVRPNTGPRITMDLDFRIEAGETSYIEIVGEDDEGDILLAELTGQADFVTKSYADIIFTPPLNLGGTSTVFTVTIGDTGEPPLSASKEIRIEIGDQLVDEPETTIVSGPALMTNQATASFTFSSDDPTATFECSIDDLNYLSCTTPATFTGLGDENHSIKIRSIDSSGNPDQSPAVFTWTVDTEAPTSPSLVFGNGASSTALIQPVTFSANDKIGVTGYCLKEQSSTPGTNDPCWMAVTKVGSFDRTIDHTFTGYGSQNLSVWFKDGADNISARANATIDLTDLSIVANPFIDIPGGQFEMGQTDMATPVHQVTVSAFRIQKYEVSATEYKGCVTAGNCVYAGGDGVGHTYERAGYEDHPVNYVKWEEARIYCQSLGGDLPTEAQWEFAARGTAGRTYPWGELEPSQAENNLANCSETSCYDGYQETAPVGSLPAGATPKGLMDMGGNVWEWVLDWYGSYSASAVTDPAGPGTGTNRVLRGGSWFSIFRYIRGSNRLSYSPENRYYDIGFRCAHPAQ